jgi:hypothetical protein
VVERTVVRAADLNPVGLAADPLLDAEPAVVCDGLDVRQVGFESELSFGRYFERAVVSGVANVVGRTRTVVVTAVALDAGSAFSIADIAVRSLGDLRGDDHA